MSAKVLSLSILPPLTVKSPVNVWAALIVNVPAPALVNAPLPEITPAIVSLPPSPVVRVPAVKTTLPRVPAIANEFIVSVAPTSYTAVLLLATITSTVSAKVLSLSTLPALIVKSPVNVWAAVIVYSPAPCLVNEPAPEIVPAIVLALPSPTVRPAVKITEELVPARANDWIVSVAPTSYIEPALLETITSTVSAKVLSLSTLPPLTVKSPVNVWAALIVNVPAPALVNVLAPEITPAIVLSSPSPVVRPAVKTTLPWVPTSNEFIVSVAPTSYIAVALLATITSAASPKVLLLSTWPALTVKSPEYEFAADNVNTPAPVFSRAAEPVNPALMFNVALVATVITELAAILVTPAYVEVPVAPSVPLNARASAVE